MEMHWATVWESIADVVGDHPATTNGDVTRSWREFDDRAARLASVFIEAGLGQDSKVALYLYNGNEYLEAQYAAFKFRGVPINVNYRYLDDELWYLLDNADAEALVFHTSLGDRVERIIDRLPGLKLLIEVDDGGTSLGDRAEPFEDVIGRHPPMERIARSHDDTYMLYTGGTTGLPKGVMYPIGDHTQFFVNLAFPAMGLTPTDDASELASIAQQLHAEGRGTVSTSGAPLMHGTGLWLGAMMHHLAGGHVLTLASRSLDPHEVLSTLQRHASTHLTIVGDSFAKPLLTAFDEAADRGEPYDLSALAMIISSGVMWTSEVKEALLDRVPHLILLDAIGSTEGSIGSQITTRGAASETARFAMNPTTKVFKEDDTEVVPGSGEIGMVAAGGMVPIGYFKDPEKTARTFRTIDGVRYSFPGDLAQVAADGSLILLGRGSQVINSGGEKIYPEEVEEAVKRTPGIIDCLVVGVDDDRFGQSVTAVVSVAEGASPSEDDVIAEVKQQLSGYKAPKRVVFVAEVPRAPNGKADYRAARELAESHVSGVAGEGGSVTGDHLT